MTDRAVFGAHAGMLAWALIVGLSFPAVRMLGDGLPPLTATALRLVIAAAVMLPLASRQRGLWPCPRAIALYGLMGLSLAAFFGAMFWAARQATALSMATLYVSVPLLTYVLGRAFGVERRAGALLAILALGAVGALGLNLAEAGQPTSSAGIGLSEAAFLAGCVGSALYPVLSKWGLQRGWLAQQAEVRTLWSMAAGGTIVAALAWLAESPPPLSAVAGREGLVLLYLGVCSTGVTFWLMQRATAVLTPAAVTAYSYLAPLASLLLLLAMHPEQLGLRWLPGSVLVLLSIALLLGRDAAAQAAAGRAPAR